MTIKRIIPCLDVKDGRVVKGIHFVHLRDAGDPVELASYYEREGADELVLLDISATTERRKTMLNVVRDVTSNVTIPVTVGGGMSTLEDMRAVIEAGADKVSVNTGAVKNPNLLAEGAVAFGTERIVLAIDAKYDNEAGTWRVYTNGGQKATDKEVLAWAKDAVDRGAGEILLTSIDRDGEKGGYDIELTKAVSAAVHVPVVASGGAGTLEHFYDILTKGNADAALAASIFHYKETSVSKVKQQLKMRGVAVQ